MAFFRYGELPLVILALLARRAMNGYELIGELERSFRPHYVPSPGSIYPALAALSRERLVKASADGATKRYELTKAGAEALRAREADLSAIELRTGTFLRAEDDVRAELARLESAVREAERSVDPAVVRRILRKARAGIEALMDEGGTR